MSTDTLIQLREDEALLLECYAITFLEYERAPTNEEALSYAEIKNRGDLWHCQRLLHSHDYLTLEGGSYSVTQKGLDRFSLKAEFIKQKTLFDGALVTASDFLLDNLSDMTDEEISELVLGLFSNPNVFRIIALTLNGFEYSGTFKVTKTCQHKSHNQDLDIADFHSHVHRGFQSYCKPCQLKANDDWRKRQKQKDQFKLAFGKLSPRLRAELMAELGSLDSDEAQS